MNSDGKVLFWDTEEINLQHFFLISHLQGIVLHIPKLSWMGSRETCPEVLPKVMASFSADFTVLSVCSVPTVFLVERKVNGTSVTAPRFFAFKFRPFH